MNNIIGFPNCHCQHKESELEELAQIDIDELTDIDYEAMYTENNDLISTDKCFKCGHGFNSDDIIWRIDQNPGYESILDSCQVSISICDSCMALFISR